ncbi:hypothetical protein X975_19529, partial [Stegodyphus mimosarum]
MSSFIIQTKVWKTCFSIAVPNIYYFSITRVYSF